MQNRDLKTWLTADAWAAYEFELATLQELRSDVRKKTDAVREYERLVRLANLAYNSGEGDSVRGKSATARSRTSGENFFVVLLMMLHPTR